MELLGTKLIGDFTVGQVGGATLGILLLFFVISALSGKKDTAASLMDEVTCKNCGWHGKVSRYNRTCRGCNAKL